MAEKKSKGPGRQKRKKADKGPAEDHRFDLGAKEVLGEVMDILAPAAKHLLLAEKELLLAVRAVLDKAIEKTDEMAAKQKKRGERARKVKIKVD
jgi:hypothetical protein